MKSILIGIAILAASLSGCGKSPMEGVTVGGLYSIQDGTEFKVVKVLAAADGIVHVRVYKNKFAKRPESVDPSTLSLGSIKDKEGFGMGHLPLARTMFDGWTPRLIMETKVLDEELDGYREWKGSGGGAFK